MLPQSQEEFNQILISVSKGREDERVDALNRLHSVAAKSEIRDFDWVIDEDLSLYSCLVKALNNQWIRDLTGRISRMESLCLAIWSRISLMTEFRPEIAYFVETMVQDSFIEKGINRIVILSTEKTPEGANTKTLLPLNAVKLLQHFFLNLYQHNEASRVPIRKYLCKYLMATQSTHRMTKPSPDVIRTNDSGEARNHVAYLLQILHAIISGFGSFDSLSSLSASSDTIQLLENQYFQRKELLLEILLPLHLPNEMIEWRDQIPVLQLYHEDLCRCIITLLERSNTLPEGFEDQFTAITSHNSLLSEAIRVILTCWPDSFNTNTPKQVLLLHELEMLLERCSEKEFAMIQRQLLSRLVQCIGTNADNIRPAQRALQYFKNPKLLALFLCTKTKSLINPEYSIGKVTLIELLPALYRGGQLSWNPTVNKMTALALKGLMDTNRDLFSEQCNIYLSHRIAPSSRQKTASLMAPPKPVAAVTSGTSGGIQQPEKKQRMLPPTARPTPTVAADPKVPNPAAKYMTKLDKGSQPPVTITGVAPWAMNKSTAAMDVTPSGSKTEPPVTITGVAPWAIKNNINDSNNMTAKANPPVTITGVAPWAMKSPSTNNATVTNSANNSNPSLQQKEVDLVDPEIANATASVSEPTSGEEIIRRYMKQCYEDVFQDSTNDSKSHRPGMEHDWNQSQLANKPQLLPSLKFHDLVFGQVLGEGAFSIVKYARQITKGKSQSQWPEYAIKIIDAKKVLEHQYSLSVVREICILQAISHPNIARLTSAFQYHQSAYLVLEYAKQGDLHTFLVHHGKITDHKLMRFIVGELTAALVSLHELGFCYNDLKPENILITELGHIKLTDFGACRPIHATAHQIVIEHVQHLLFMRNGNWKEDDVDTDFQRDNLQSLFNPVELTRQFQSLQQHPGSDRCEGTAAYMPPETFSATGYYSEGVDPMVDAWALGCVLYFMYYGKPPFYGEPSQVIEQMKDFFDEHHHHNNNESKIHVHFTDSKEDEGKELLPSFQSVLEVMNHSCEELIYQLLHREPKQRLSIARLSDHSYLTRGYTSSYESSITSLATSEESLRSDCPIYQPLQLYQQTAPLWPSYDGSEGKSGLNDKWARRQFSSLWAPMPPQYSMQTSNQGAVSLSPGIRSSIQDDLLANLLLLRQPLPIVTETFPPL